MTPYWNRGPYSGAYNYVECLLAVYNIWNDLWGECFGVGGCDVVIGHFIHTGTGLSSMFNWQTWLRNATNWTGNVNYYKYVIYYVDLQLHSSIWELWKMNIRTNFAM